MRLIDADILSREIESLKIIISQKQIFTKEIKETMIRIINEQPTAFDKDKVIEELDNVSRCMTIDHSDYREHLPAIDRVKALEIVMRGGIDEG